MDTHMTGSFTTWLTLCASLAVATEDVPPVSYQPPCPQPPVILGCPDPGDLPCVCDPCNPVCAPPLCEPTVPPADSPCCETPELPCSLTVVPPPALRRYPHLDLEGDFLLWRVKGGPLPIPLVSSGSATDAIPGAIGQPGTQILYGGSPASYGWLPGGRVAVAFRTDRESPWAVQLGGFVLARTEDAFSASGDAVGNTVVGQPILNALNNPATPGTFLVSDPTPGTRLRGSVAISNTSSLFGYEANVVRDLDAGMNSLVLRGLFGFRSIGLREKYRESATVTEVDPGLLTILGVPTSTITTVDRINADTDFYGGQVGARAIWQVGIFDVDVLGKVGLGVSRQRVDLSGLSTGDAGVSAAGGVRVLSSNAGAYSRSEFAVVPEVGVNLGLVVNDYCRVQVGYTFLYISRVARPGDQLDAQVNPNLVPTDADFGLGGGPARPAVQRNSSDFYAHGLNFGLMFSF